MATEQERVIIHSLVTVGIRHHCHQEYAFHPLRTDFTGENGVGKSIVGDLLQLILVVRRDTWRSGTEGMDKDKRRIETMPLEGVETGYALLNVEVQPGKFVAIGVCISARSSVPVKAFIIHRGAEMTPNVALLSFAETIRQADFLHEGMIADMVGVKRKLFQVHGLYLHEFSRGELIKDYHRVLFKNRILPVDLSIEANLQMFANVIQSFSRAKSLEINKSSSLKNFIFPAQEDVFKSFSDKKDQLTKYIRDFHNLEGQRKGIQVKQGLLTKLKEQERKKREAQHDYLRIQAIHSWQQVQRHAKEKERCERELANVKSVLEQLGLDLQQLEREQSDLSKRREANLKDRGILGGLIQLKKDIDREQEKRSDAESKSSDLRRQLEEKRTQIERLKAQIHQLTDVLPTYEKEIAHHKEEWTAYSKRVDELKPLRAAVSLFGSMSEIERLFKEQLSHERSTRLLNELQGIDGYAAFDQSSFAKQGVVAFEDCAKQLQQLALEIDRLEGLSTLYDQSNPESLFHWAVTQQRALSRGQEAVLMHFKDIWTREIPAAEGAMYTEHPAALLNDVRETAEGVWVKLGSVERFVNYPGEQLFADPERLAEALKRGREEVQAMLDRARGEQSELETLRKGLQRIGFREEHWLAYLNRAEVESYRKVEGLPSPAQWEQWEALADELPQYDEIQSQSHTASGRYDHYVQLQARDKENLRRAEQEVRQEERFIQEAEETIDQLTSQSKRSLLEINAKEAQLIAKRLELSFGLDERVSMEDYVEQLEGESKTIGDRIMEIGEELKAQREIQITQNKRLGSLEAELPGFQQQFASWTESHSRHLKEFQAESDAELDAERFSGRLSQDEVSLKRTTAEKLLLEYKTGYENLVNQYEEARLAPRVLHDRYDFQTLEEVLLGAKIKHLDNVDAELASMNESLRAIAEGHWTIVIDVFKDVEQKYDTCRKTIISLNHFFQETRISRSYVIDLVFKPADGLKIEWIGKMRQAAHDQAISTGLFAENATDSPEEILERLAAGFSNSKQYSIRQLLDEKQYFDLRLDLKGADSNQLFSGSHGQSYMAISLLCIGRLSIVESERGKRPGIRFLIVEELANLDENNFSVFPKLAKEFGYQMITMTPKPFGGFTTEGAFVHMLTPGKGGSLINLPPYSAYIKDGIRGELSKYLNAGNNELEGA